MYTEIERLAVFFLYMIKKRKAWWDLTKFFFWLKTNFFLGSNRCSIWWVITGVWTSGGFLKYYIRSDSYWSPATSIPFGHLCKYVCSKVLCETYTQNLKTRCIKLLISKISQFLYRKKYRFHSSGHIIAPSVLYYKIFWSSQLWYRNLGSFLWSLYLAILCTFHFSRKSEKNIQFFAKKAYH